jgi:hypothetical protein
MKNNLKEISIFVALFLIIVGVILYFLSLVKDDFFESEKSDNKNIEIPESFKDGEREINLTWTDNNEGEDLIIQSNQKNYFGVNESIIYFSITNTNQKDQEIDIRFIFQDQNANLESIKKITSDDKTPNQEGSEWLDLPKSNQKLSFDDIENFKSSNQLEDSIKSGESNYYQAIITYPSNSKGEFYIEAKGNNNAYGILDPWYDSTGLVSYWTMDNDELEWGQSSAEVRDRNGDSHIGNAVNMDSGNAITGQVGGALSFNGTDEYVEILDSDDFTVTDFSVSLWFNSSGSTGADQIMMSNYDWDGEWTILRLQNSGDILFQVDDGSNPLGSVTSLASTYMDGDWHHVVVTRNTGGDVLSMYIDGSLSNSSGDDTDLTSINSLESFFIGKQGDGETNYFNGKIDDVLIYNKALNSTQVTDLYNLGNRQIQNRALNNTGLVGYWTMDTEDLEWGQTSAEVRDKSGNGYHGNSANMTSGNEVTGKVDGALDFNGTDEYASTSSSIGLTNPTTDEFSVCYWINLDDSSAERYVIGKAATSGKYVFRHVIGGGAIYQWIWDGSQNPSTNTGIILENRWYHVCATWDTSTAIMYLDSVNKSSNTKSLNSFSDPSVLHFGRGDYTNQYLLNGRLDEVRIYNRELSATEVANLYNDSAKKFKMSHVNDRSLKSGLVGYWSMDTRDIDWSDPSTEIKDLSDTEAHGNSINMDSSNAVSSKDGQLGQALSFNGTDEYIDLGDQSELSFNATDSQMTIGAWIYLDSSLATGDRAIFTKYDSQNLDLEYAFFVDAPNRELLFWSYEYGGAGWWKTSTADSVFSYDAWNHVLVTLDVGSDTVGFYVNGSNYVTQNDLLSGIVNMSNTTESVRMGAMRCGSGSVCNYWGGYLDEVRVYNRVLTASEITALYNLTSQKVRVEN